MDFMYAAHHLTASHAAANLVGDGGLTTVENIASLIEDTSLGRVVLRGVSVGSGSTPALPVWSKALGSPALKLVFGVRLNLESMSSGSGGGSGINTLIRIDGNVGELCRIAWTSSSNLLGFYTGSTLRAFISSLGLGAWTYLEVAVELSQTAGRLIIRLNGTTVYDDTTVTAGASVGAGAVGIAGYVMGGGSSLGGSMIRYTDWYIKEFPETEEGIFYGPISPLWRPVVSDEANDGWTPDIGDDVFARLANDNDGYVEPSAAGDVVELGLEPLPGGVTLILGQVGIAVSTAPAGGSGVVGLDFKDGMDVTEGAPSSRVIGDQTTPTTQAVLHLEGPGGVPWTPQLADDAHLLIEAV